MHHKRSIAQAFEDTVRVAQDCETICVETIQYCLQVGGAHTEPTHMRLLQDCADICQATAKFMARGSAVHAPVSGACANICDLCAASCERFTNDAQMKACADVCRLCAAACRQMAATTRHG